MVTPPNDESKPKSGLPIPGADVVAKGAETVAKGTEAVLENILWRSRFAVLFAVIGSLLAGFAMFIVSSLDVWHLFEHVFALFGESHEATPKELHHMVVAGVVEIIDGYLLATVLVIFALGLYELFISRIDPAVEDDMSANVLIINSLDDLKTRLAKVILMILIVNFFQFAIQLEITTALDLLAFGGGIALIGLALYLTHAKSHD